MNKNKKYKINAKVVTVGVLVVVVLINLFVTLLVSKFPIKLDLTSEKLYEISDETKTMLSEYDKEVNIYFIAGKSYESSYRLLGNVAEVLEKYAQYGPTITYTSIDSEKNPTFGAKYVEDGTSLNTGSVILDGGDRYKVYDYVDLYNTTTSQQGTQTASSMRAEQVLNAGLKYIASDEIFTAYFIEGHNETELAGLKKKLEDENYTVGSIKLSTDPIPEDAKLIIISAPKVDYTSAEIAKLDEFFARAGKALVTFDYQCSGLTNLYEYLKSWGILVNDDLAVESNISNLVSQLGIVLANYGESSIVSSLSENKRDIGYYPYSKSLQLLFSENSGIKVESVLCTTDDAYSTTDFENLTNSSGDTTSQVIAAVATKQGESRSEDAAIFVSGTTALMEIDEEQLAAFGFANYDYISNVLSYLQGSYEDNTIAPKYLSTGRLMIDSLQGFIIGGIFTLLIPIIILIYGIVVWVRRRHL